MQLDESKKEMFRSVNDLVVESLQQVFDPEMPSISVYDLGLIYLLETSDEGAVKCEHTLTSMACPFADQICNDIETAIKETPGVTSVSRELVFDPQFTMDMVPEETKLVMGWY
jgi:metal-sulfur cluster biosynthetic enzyme|tara:strand:- start:39 stop:377 length:339 start_codon:yes stop_codon:yes gene_type:complete